MLIDAGSSMSARDKVRETDGHRDRDREHACMHIMILHMYIYENETFA